MNFYQEILGSLMLEDGEGIPFATRFTADSRKVERRCGFVAIPGTKNDGHAFIGQAIEAGAKVIIHQNPYKFPEGVAHLQVSDSSRAYSLLLRAKAGYPDEALALFGVTGTNGKTTTAFLMNHLLQTAGIGCGLVSTIEYRDGKYCIPGDRTTPEPERLFALFKAMKENKMLAVSMELSSHSLAQGRAAGCRFKEAVFTNLTGDHLDYHGDMEHYYQAKKLFFTELLAPDGCAVLNIDDPYGKRLAAELLCRKITFGEDAKSDCRIVNASLTQAGVQFQLEGAFKLTVKSPFFGLYNIHNLAGAALAALDFGIQPEIVENALAVPVRVPGRLEKVQSPNGALFFIDYAHTDDALRNVLAAVRPGVTGCLIVLFGAGGDRDRSKRPRMGRTAAEGADMLIVTSDNPRSEEPEAIIGEIVAGIPAGTKVQVIPDRREAIRFAAETAKKGDVVILAGKGHENYQEICGEKKHFSDRETLEEFLR